MAKSKVNAKIENGKVILSDEILSILESWKTSDEKVELVEKYKRILLDSSNLNAPKFRQHHIIPTFMFKDENHKNRKETEPLANAIEGNKIKLSVYNHIIVHDILRHIFPNNLDAKLAVYLSCRKVNIENFTEKKIEEIAQILQDCSKTNKTDEEKKEYLKKYNKNYRNENKENLSIYGKNWRKENKEKEKEWRKNYNEKK